MNTRALWLLAALAACSTILEPATKPADSVDTEVQPTDSDTDDSVEDTDPIEVRDTGQDLFARLRLPQDVHPVGEEALIYGRVWSESHPLDQLTIGLRSHLEGTLSPAPVLDAEGRFSWSTENMTAGSHRITLTVTDPDGDEAEAEIEVGVCDYPPMETFTVDPTGGDWTTYGDATWDSQGWLEITGNAQSRAGSIYKTANKVNPGDFKIEFRIATGGGINTGADGFSVNIVDVPDVAGLSEYVNRAANGGCLGYGLARGCSTGTVSAFHVEMDTWYNGEYLDPTQNNHIAINLDGDPGGHQAWAEVASLENLAWRHIVVEGVDERITLDMDGVRIIDAILPNFTFDGGYIGVSGSTGYATNFHRFDDLRVYDRCIVPTP